MSGRKSGGGVIAAVVIGLGLAAAPAHHHGHSGNLLTSVAHSLSSPEHFSAAPRSRRGWARAFLAGARLPVTRCNLSAVTEWEIREGGGFGNQAENNPLNVNPPADVGWPGYHAIGAWAFPSARDGLVYTIRTIYNGNYGEILAALRAGNDAQAVCNAIMASPWASSHYDGTLRASC